jgi:Tfp pilus assembly protein FimT
MMTTRINSRKRSQAGLSLVELVVVAGIATILTAIALPQMISQRRLTRSVAITRELLTQMRYARQLAMSQSGATATGTMRRVAFTFQYDDTTKQIKVIGPIPAGTAALSDSLYPNNAGSSTVVASYLSQGGIAATHISSGVPTGMPTFPTSVDGINAASLAGGKLNITFQPDGSVIDTAGNPVDKALFIYNNQASQATASAVTVRGSSGRVKIWRYTVNASNANASNYVE